MAHFLPLTLPSPAGRGKLRRFFLSTRERMAVRPGEAKPRAIIPQSLTPRLNCASKWEEPQIIMSL